MDVLFLDIKMTGMDGMETAQRIRKADDRLELIRPVTAAEFWDHVDKTIGEEERLWR